MKTTPAVATCHTWTTSIYYLGQVYVGWSYVMLSSLECLVVFWVESHRCHSPDSHLHNIHTLQLTNYTLNTPVGLGRKYRQ